jgi:hypothetical protein
MLTDEQKQRARELGLFALALVLVAAAGYSAGRFSAPAEVEERVEYRTEWRTKTVEVVRWKTARAVDTRTTSTPVLLPAPDGGVVLAAATVTETRERETAAGSSDTRSSTRSLAQQVGERKVTQLPDWRLGVQIGASLRDPLLPIAGPLVLGVSVERRILGGVSAGVWGNTLGAAGVSVSGEF